MATTFTLNTDKYDGRYLSLSLTQEKDIANNKSTIKWTLSSVGGNSNYYTTGATTVYIAGEKVYEKARTAWTTYTFPAKKGSVSGELEVSHNDSDGSKSVEVSITTAIYVAALSTVKGTWTLDSNPRKATLLTAPNFNDGENPIITYKNPAGDSVTSLQACISFTGAKDDIPYRDIPKTGTSYTFNFTEEERQTLWDECKDTKPITVRFGIRTKIGGSTLYSTLERTFSLGTANPIITASVVDTNEKTVALTGDNTVLIKYHSNAEATMSATPQKGAVIDENLYIIRNGNDTGYGTSYTFENTESDVFTFSAEDNRGNVGTIILTPNMVEYTKLTCNIANNRPDGEGNMTVACSGNFFNGSFGAESNTLKVQYRYSGNSKWTDMTVTKSGNSYYAYASLTGLDYRQTYTFETQAIDKLMTVPSTASKVKSIPVFHWGENDFAFEVPVKFNGGIDSIEGDFKLSGDDTNTFYFGNDTKCYIEKAANNNMTVRAPRIDLVANGVYVDGYAIPKLSHGIWAPELIAGAVSSYTTQYGWYMKMNQYVTVGFIIKANCNVGYQNTNISIYGLPYTPMFSAAGGGMCSGACVADNHDFQCFVAETSGTITIRVQACNNTEYKNLSTSASGCRYPSGGGVLTLSGTITYMATS